MKVSVIVPVYNTENYLRKCFDSLINQTLKDIEIIIVNDGSPDNSQEIIDEYTKKYPNIKSFKKENGGLSSARNYGIGKAKGEYIIFVDSDDYVSLDMCEKMYKKAKTDRLDLVICDSINVYPDNSEVYISSVKHYSEDAVKNYIIAPPMACIRIYKRCIFDKIKFRENILYEDLELAPRVLGVTKKIGFLEEGLYYYVQRDGSIMKQKVFNEKLLDIFTVLEVNKKLLEAEYKEEVEYLYITHLLRTASLRFLNYDEAKIYLEKIIIIMKSFFPNWKNNCYYKKSGIKIQVLCNLAYRKQFKPLKLIKKLTNK